MQRENKQKLLTAFDALGAITNGRKSKRKSSHGSGITCDHCGVSNATPSGHLECPIQKALRLLVPLVPPFSDREVWLNDSGQ